jgi:RecA-family ATPase
MVGAQSIDFTELADLHFVPFADRDAVMGMLDGKSGIIRETDIWRELAAIAAPIKPRLVVLDTLADVFAGNEIVRQEARQFVSILRRLAIEQRLAVVLLSHPSLSGMVSGTGTSGSTAWNNSVRSRLYLETVKGDDGREAASDGRVLRVKKANYGPSGLALRLRWSNGFFVLDTPVSGIDKLASEAKAERIFLDLLVAFAAQGRDVSAKSSRTYAPVVFARNPAAEGFGKKLSKPRWNACWPPAASRTSGHLRNRARA